MQNQFRLSSRLFLTKGRLVRPTLRCFATNDGVDKCPGMVSTAARLVIVLPTKFFPVVSLIVSFEDISRALYRIQSGIKRTVSFHDPC